MQKERSKADSYRKAAYEGDAKAMNNLGVCYHRGLGVKENHQMAFIVLLATVLGYFLIPFAMRSLSATAVSIYTNLQPMVASFIAIIIGQDRLTWDKPVAAVLVLLSAYIVTVMAADGRNTKTRERE